jgi:outer membrane protein assembly factor BamB
MSQHSNQATRRPSFSKLALLFFTCALLLCGVGALDTKAAAAWSTKLDGRVRFYQQTELGVIVAGTEKSLYAVEAETGDILWRRKDTRVDETDVAAVPGTDVLLLTVERGDKTRLEATDLLTGDTLWRSDKVRGSVMQMAFEPSSNLLALVLARDAHSRPREGFKKKPILRVFDLNAGKQLWERELESEVEMMPALSASDKDNDEVAYTLDNYRAPVFLDGRLYLFYEGLTSLDAMTGKERRREKFRVNEEGLALTESDPVADERNIYLSGRGHVRAISRESGEEVWEAKDLGLTPEILLQSGVLYVRTGGQFTRLKDGEGVERGSYGVSAVDAASGKILWRYKGADKGITNLALPDASTIIVADHDDLIFLDAATGKRRRKISHNIKNAAFVLLNERSEVVVGGTNEVAAFDIRDGRNVWRERHTPPGRGVFRTLAAIAARASSLYFRYGSAATTIFRGAQLLNTVGSLRWSGLAAHATVPDLTSLASNSARDYVRERFSTYGVLSRVRQNAGRIATLREQGLPQLPRPSAALPRPDVDVEGHLLDRLDPATQLERLSRFLWRRRQLATLRGEWMYFFTELESGGRGLAGVNINTGATERAVRISDPDERFINDEVTNLLYTANDNRLLAYVLNRP